VSGVTFTGPSTRTGRSSTCWSPRAETRPPRDWFFQRALTMLKVTPTEVVTDAAPIYPAIVEELMPAAWHHIEKHANNPIEADHSQLKHRLRPMRGLRTDKTAQVIIAGHAFMQNLRRGRYELAIDVPRVARVAAAFTELACAI
jgi:transposase-like protein